jgi:ABC-type oligopeptide transport system substrate-binding subunit
MNWTVRLALLVALALALQACATVGAYYGYVEPPDDDQVLVIGNQSEPRSVDPHKTAGVPEANIMLNIYDGLTTYDPRTAEPLPCLATSWERNEDASVWTFHLRENATWTDGTPITAHDFVWSWQRIVNPDTASPYASLLYYVKNGERINDPEREDHIADPTRLGVRAVDDHTLEVTMERPTAFFVAMTPHYAFTAVPRHAIEKYGDAWTAPEHHVSSGPFRLVERILQDRIIVDKWEGHWDAANVKLRRIIFLAIEEQDTAVNLYKANYMHITAGGGQAVPKAFVKALRGKKDFYISPEFGTYYYSLNVKRPPLDNVLVRRALNMAIDKQAICEKVLEAGQQPAWSWVPPGLTGYPYPQGPRYDPEGARELLAKAGYPGGAGFPEIQIYFNTLESHRQIAEAVQNMWKEVLGIPVTLRNQEWQAFQATREGRRFDVARDGWIADYMDPSTFLADLFQTDSLNNHPGWVDPKFTRLMIIGNSEPDQAKRYEIMAEAEALLLDAMPVIPLYYYASVKLRKPYIDGFYDNPLDQHPLKFVSINKHWKHGEEPS